MDIVITVPDDIDTTGAFPDGVDVELCTIVRDRTLAFQQEQIRQKAAADILAAADAMTAAFAASAVAPAVPAVKVAS